MAECEVIHQFSKQKSKLNFSQKSDGEFILFLLDTTMSMLSMGKSFLDFCLIFASYLANSLRGLDAIVSSEDRSYVDCRAWPLFGYAAKISTIVIVTFVILLL